MSLYIDLLITNNDLTLDPSNQPVLVDDRASIAQDIAHMIRESGLLVTLMAERDRFRQADCIQQLELLVETDERLVPGTVQITETGSGQYRVAATTVAFGTTEVVM
ncbi:DUF2590 family protein [Pseudomonas alloputida]|uniref:DUF2590 family protein n=1 Tax=Pseudomonas alloputida TaxID=1940621 RepID=UPI001E4406CD|nr:DUF2590 family protein [Pseudomonas alloputida]MCE1054115.1 DUF2590 family protein [Pseudomonas alloputida]